MVEKFIVILAPPQLQIYSHLFNLVQLLMTWIEVHRTRTPLPLVIVKFKDRSRGFKHERGKRRKATSCRDQVIVLDDCDFR